VSDKRRKNRLIIGIALLAVLALAIATTLWLFLPRNPTLNEQPQLDEKFQNWTLVVDGSVDKPLNLSVSNLLSMPSTAVNAPLYCVGSGTQYPVENGTWEGVRLKLILEKAGIRPSAIKVAFYAPDGFSTDLTIQDAQRNNVIIAYKKDGEFLKDRNGNPDFRLVVPGKWGYKWIRTLNHMELVDYDFKGFYEGRGYSDEANIE
jgi:DMSO/TMAO reductase YedYZ molybdopterin-dependent catalytic subunit